MKFMYWPNEISSEDISKAQVGPRKAFAALQDDGKLTDLEIFSYRIKLKESGSIGKFQNTAMQEIQRFAPDILFVQHVTGTNLGSGFWSEIRRLYPRLTIVYHDADPYDANVKKIDNSMRQILAVSDLVLVCGLGFISKQFKILTPGIVRYLPHSFDNFRFARSHPADVEKNTDIIMIGNRGTRKRVPFLYVPGGRKRADLAAKLSSRFGQNFALYGSGWSHLESARGALPFYQQEMAIQGAKISVNWDHFDAIPYYFSDRLPISLSAGVPHITSHHLGYEQLFKSCPGLYFFKTPAEIIECAQWLLSRPDRELLEEGLQARNWCKENLEANVVYENAFQMARNLHERGERSL